jgi:hypothetical protein
MDGEDREESSGGKALNPKLAERFVYRLTQGRLKGGAAALKLLFSQTAWHVDKGVEHNRYRRAWQWQLKEIGRAHV